MDIFWFLHVIVLLAVEGLVMCAPSSGRKEARKIKLNEAMNIPQKFPCEIPQQRSYYLAELMDGMFENTTETVDYPVCVVISRCDRYAGCCSSPDLTCAPVVSDIYYDEVEVMISNIETRKTENRWIKIEQHGRCNCTNYEHVVDTKMVKVTFIKGSSTDLKGLKRTSG